MTFRHICCVCVFSHYESFTRTPYSIHICVASLCQCSGMPAFSNIALSPLHQTLFLAHYSNRAIRLFCSSIFRCGEIIKAMEIQWARNQWIRTPFDGCAYNMRKRIVNEANDLPWRLFTLLKSVNFELRARLYGCVCVCVRISILLFVWLCQRFDASAYRCIWYSRVYIRVYVSPITVAVSLYGVIGVWRRCKRLIQAKARNHTRTLFHTYTHTCTETQQTHAHILTYVRN